MRILHQYSRGELCSGLGFVSKSVVYITILETVLEGHLCSPEDFFWEVAAEGQELEVSERQVE